MGEFYLYVGLMCVVWDLFSFCFSHAGRERCVCRRIRNGGKIRGKYWIFHGFFWGKTAQNVGFGLFYGGNVCLKGEICSYVR